MTPVDTNTKPINDSEKMIDIVLDVVAALPVEPPPSTATVKRSVIVLLRAVFSRLRLNCLGSNAVQVTHPPTPPLKPVPAKEEQTDDELPPLEPSPEKV